MCSTVSTPHIEEVIEAVKASRKYSGRTLSESVHVLIHKRLDEDNTQCSHQAYCNVWGNIWVAIATPVLIMTVLCLVTWLLICALSKQLANETGNNGSIQTYLENAETVHVTK